MFYPILSKCASLRNSSLRNLTGASAAAVALLGLCAVPGHAQAFTPTLPTGVSTSLISTEKGYYEFQFNPDAGVGPITNPATAFITNISYGGATDQNVTLTNGGAGGDAYIAMTRPFGSSFTFDYTFSPGSLPLADSGDDLELFFYSANQSPVLTTDPSGYNLVADIHIAPGQRPGDPVEISSSTFAVLASPVPEASTTVSFGLLLAFGLGGTAFTARKRKDAAAA